MKSCNGKDEADEQFHIDTLYIERFYIELNDPISCRVPLPSQKLSVLIIHFRLSVSHLCSPSLSPQPPHSLLSVTLVK